MAVWLLGLVRSHDNLKLVYLRCSSTYGNQTWQAGNLPWGLLPIMLLHPLVTWCCEIKWETKANISPLPQYLWRQTWQNNDLPCLTSTHKITWPYNHVVTNQVIYPLTQCLWLPTLVGWRYTKENFPSIKSTDPLITFSWKVK